MGVFLGVPSNGTHNERTLPVNKQVSAAATARITSSLQSDVVSYIERGELMAEFEICGKQVTARGYAASIVQGAKKGTRVTVVGQTVTKQWVSRDTRFDGGEAVLKSRSNMHAIRATRITLGG